jgi:hypothetical protein
MDDEELFGCLIVCLIFLAAIWIAVKMWHICPIISIIIIIWLFSE